MLVDGSLLSFGNDPVGVPPPESNEFTLALWSQCQDSVARG